MFKRYVTAATAAVRDTLIRRQIEVSWMACLRKP